MKTIDQNRNFTVSAKTTAGQKARYIQEAQKHDISLSEWICSTLDLGLNTYGEVNKPIGQIRFLEESILAKDKENKILASDLEKTKFDRDIKKALVLRQTKTIMALESKNKNLLAKTGGLIIVGSNEKVKNDNKIIPENEALSLVSGASLLLSIIALGRK